MELEYVHATWSPAGPNTPDDRAVGVDPSNSELHRFLFDVAGRYIACATGNPNAPVEFSYCLFVVRGQADGYLRLDVNQTIVVVGFDRVRTPREALGQIAARYATFDDSQTAISVVPPITFGATETFGYYITSPHGPGIAHPDTVRNAVRFIAEYVILAGCDDDLPRALGVADDLGTGRDEQGVLATEPLIASIIASAPEETRPHMIAELGSELRRMLEP